MHLVVRNLQMTQWGWLVPDPQSVPHRGADTKAESDLMAETRIIWRFLYSCAWCLDGTIKLNMTSWLLQMSSIA